MALSWGKRMSVLPRVEYRHHEAHLSPHQNEYRDPGSIGSSRHPRTIEYITGPTPKFHGAVVAYDAADWPAATRVHVALAAIVACIVGVAFPVVDHTVLVAVLRAIEHATLVGVVVKMSV